MIKTALLTILMQAAAPPQSETNPMPTGTEMETLVAEADSRLFWAAFEQCEPSALEELLLPDFRMIHDLGGLAVPDRASFIATLEQGCADREPGGANPGYRNRRLLVPGSRNVRQMGDWGALEESAHVFFEWRGAAGDEGGPGEGWVMVGGARYMHLWQWMPSIERFKLSQSYSYDHGSAASYPPDD